MRLVLLISCIDKISPLKHSPVFTLKVSSHRHDQLCLRFTRRPSDASWGRSWELLEETQGMLQDAVCWTGQTRPEAAGNGPLSASTHCNRGAGTCWCPMEGGCHVYDGQVIRHYVHFDFTLTPMCVSTVYKLTIITKSYIGFEALHGKLSICIWFALTPCVYLLAR